MIAYIKGKIIELGARHAIVENHDIGYKIYITDDTIHSLKIDQTVSFWIHMVVREDTQDLYGFVEKKEKNFFELLITVSGIGPKSALNILSLISSDALLSSIRNGSTAHLVKISGIGRKTAEKIILELRDKLGTFEVGETDATMSSDSDTLEALKALGYDIDTAREALKQVDKGVLDTGAKVKAALRILGK